MAFPFSFGRRKENPEVQQLKKLVEQLSFSNAMEKELVMRDPNISTRSPYHPAYGEENQLPKDPMQSTPRPIFRINPLQSAGIQYPQTPVNLYDLYNVSAASDTVQKVLLAFKRDLFRRGIVWKPRWERKCPQCETEYEHPVKMCETCTGTTGDNPEETPTGTAPPLLKPDNKEKLKFERFIREANHNGQPLADVCRELEDDFNTCDNAFLIIRKKLVVMRKPGVEPVGSHEQLEQYFTKEQAERVIKSLVKEVTQQTLMELWNKSVNGVIWEEVDELIRGDPLRMRIVGNIRGGIGGRYWVCVDHRTRPEDRDPNLTGNQASEQAPYQYGEFKSWVQLYERPGICNVCSKPLFEVYYAATDGAFQIQEPYIRGEVIHGKRFQPGLVYGRSPLIGLWKDVVTRLRMKQYINEYFRYFRYPRGVLVAMTDNPESFYRFWDAQMERIKYDPWHIPALAIEKKDGRGFFDFIKFTGTFEELQYHENIAECERTIFEHFGVMETTADSNQGTTGLYLKLTPGAISFHQNTYEDNIFPRLLEQFHIYDWKLEILPTEEENEIEVLAVRLKKIEVAERMMAMGVRVTLDSTGDFVFTGQPHSPEMMQQMMGGGQGGGQDTGEDETSDIDALLGDMVGGESDKRRGQEGETGPAEKQE